VPRPGPALLHLRSAPAMAGSLPSPRPWTWRPWRPCVGACASRVGRPPGSKA